MCGLVVRWRKNRHAPDDGFAARAAAAIAHRGPDGSGIRRPSPSVEMIHHRLAIVSPEDGAQPLVDEATGVSVVYNGEIYNFKDLRKDLERQGHAFRTGCDTEVLLRLYLERGTAMVDDLNGIFAFVIHDPRNGTLFGARDRMGVKPLYIARTADAFVCASEIKAVLEDPSVPRRTDAERIHEYLVFGFMAGAATQFRDVDQIEPGCRFVFNNGDLRIERYWDEREPAAPLTDEGEIVERLDALLSDAVGRQLMADVPLAVLLSGGVDSGLVTHYAHRHDPGLRAYTLRDLEEGYDETRYAAAVTGPRGMDLRIVDIDGRAVIDSLEAVAWHYDEPLIQTNTIGLYRLCRQIAGDGFKVLLCGEGGDELFGGYDRHLETLEAMRAGDGDALMYGRNRVAFERIERFWPGQERRFPRREALVAGLSSLLPGNRILVQDQKAYLLHLLQRPDRIGMACGIELRVPLLDHRVVELANAIHPALKIHRRQKHILKALAERHLPFDLIHRPKQAFDTPIVQALAQGPVHDAFLDLVAPASRVAGLFDIKAIGRMHDDLKRGDTALWRILWQILTLELWMRLYRVEI